MPVPGLTLHEISNASERSLLTRWYQTNLAAGATDLGDAELADLHKLIERVDQVLTEWLKPGTRKQSAQLILDMADLMGALVPGERGLELFITAIEDLPGALHEVAALRVARTHKYPRLPLPADFLATVAGEVEYVREQRAMLAMTRRNIETLINRRETHQRRFQS